MKKDILKIIEENLPIEVGKILQIRLKQAAEDLENVKQLKRENENLMNDIAGIKCERDAAVVQRNEALETCKNLESTRKELDEKRRNGLDKQMSECRAVEAEKRADQLKEVLGIVFRSPVYKKSYSEQNDGTLFTDYINGQNKTIPTNIPSSKNIREEIIEE